MPGIQPGRTPEIIVVQEEVEDASEQTHTARRAPWDQQGYNLRGYTWLPHKSEDAAQ